jgi:predicted 2-oxoglutarate/Fe(II)-dependent dioxygenase YbiX
MPKKFSESFLKICQDQKFNLQGTLASDNAAGGKLNKKIRDTKIWVLSNKNPKSRTEIHWCNLFLNLFEKKFDKYFSDVTQNTEKLTVQTIDVLKYSVGGHYQFHTDHGPTTPRTLSAIYFVNDNYKGGELEVMTGSHSKDRFKMTKEQGSIIIFPSYMLHQVLPIKKGQRYSLVSWITGPSLK